MKGILGKKKSWKFPGYYPITVHFSPLLQGDHLKKKKKKSLTLRPHVVSNLFLVQFKIKIRSELFTEQRVGGRCKSLKTVDRRQDDYGSGNRHFENPLDNQSNHMTTNMTLLPPPRSPPPLTTCSSDRTTRPKENRRKHFQTFAGLALTS